LALAEPGDDLQFLQIKPGREHFERGFIVWQAIYGTYLAIVFAKPIKFG
jgi:hypothetical protein